MPPKKMEAKVAALETEVASLRTTLVTVQEQAENNQARLIDLLSQKLSKQAQEREETESVRNLGTPSRSGTEQGGPSCVSGWTRLDGGQLDEFRKSAKKVELPLFNGEDPVGWIARAEVYFHVMGTSPKVKVNLAYLCMEGATIHYFNSLLHLDPGLTWEKLTNELLERYGTANKGDVFEQLSDLQQRGTIDEYVIEFERLLSQTPNLPDEQYFGYFIHGLREDIRARVRSMRALTTLPRSRLIPLARAVEIELHGPGRSLTGSRGSGSRFSYGLGSFNRPTHQSSPGPGPAGQYPTQGWVMVKNRDDKGERREDWSMPRPPPRDRGVRHLPY